MCLRLIAAALLLSACQLALPGRTPAPDAANPITTGQISVTALDEPSAAGASVPDLSAADPTAPAQPEPTADGPPPAEPAVPELVVPALAEPEPAPVAAPVAPPKSASQQACEKGGGAWVGAGTTGTMICQKPQRDGGKQCSRESDCEGQCLARSRTCAPVAPLFGCNEVLQNNGQRVTLCIE